jgi:hypothetical protein
MKAENYPSERWLSLALAFAGGYGDSASFVLANTFAGHVTGAFVLAAISVASYDWPTFWRRFIGIVFSRGYPLERKSETIRCQEATIVSTFFGDGYRDSPDLHSLPRNHFSIGFKTRNVCELYVPGTGPSKWHLAESRRH